MTPESSKLYKLIILYFLKRTGQEIPNAILSDFILEHGYTDYFSIQQTLHALTEDQMINANQTKTSAYYQITKKGLETFDFFGSQLPSDTRCQIDDYLRQHKMSILETTSVHTDYTRIKSREYLAKGSLRERGSTLLEVALNVPSEEDAAKVCKRFQEKQDEIYQYLYLILTQEEPS